jgi:hypothetical protein
MLLEYDHFWFYSFLKTPQFMTEILFWKDAIFWINFTSL